LAGALRILQPSSGRPGRAYQLLFAVRATAEEGTLFRGLRITYQVDGRLTEHR
jgi:hypothetical protein